MSATNKTLLLIIFLLLVISLFVMYCWMFEQQTMYKNFSGIFVMVFNTALGFALTSLGLVDSLIRGKNYLQLIIGVLLFISSLLILLQYIIYIPINLDQIFVKVTVPIHHFPGRVSPITAVGFLLIGIMFTLLQFTQIKYVLCSSYLIALSVLLISFIGFFENRVLFDALNFWTIHNRMALQTSFCFFITAIALLILWKEKAHMSGINFTNYNNAKGLVVLTFSYISALIIFALIFSTLIYHIKKPPFDKNSIIRQTSISEIHLRAPFIEHLTCFQATTSLLQAPRPA